MTLSINTFPFNSLIYFKDSSSAILYYNICIYEIKERKVTLMMELSLIILIMELSLIIF